MLSVTTHQQCPASHVHAATNREAALDRVTELASIRFIDDRENFADAMPQRIVPISPNKRLGSQIHVVNATDLHCPS